MSNDLTLLNVILEEYYKDILEDYTQDEAFELFVVDNYLKKYDLTYEELEDGLIGGKKDWGCDGFYIIINDNLISNFEDYLDIKISRNDTVSCYVFQFKNKTSFEESVLEKFLSFSNHLTRLDKKFDDSEKVFDKKLIEKMTLFHQIIKDSAPKYINVEITYIHATKGNVEAKKDETKKNNASYLQKAKDLEDYYQEINLGYTTKFRFEMLGAAELRRLAAEEKSYTSTLRINDNNIFVEYDDGIESNNQRGYIVTAKLSDYFDFLTEKGKNPVVLKKYLFDSNVRDFQNKTEVNKDIQKTLIEINSKQDFWWLNNGITILADEGNIVGRDFNMENIKIVNGLQTSYSIFNAFKDTSLEERKKDQRTIFCKIIITDNEETVDKIIKATNSQNPISSALLRATDNIQRDIEVYLLKHNLYYDRRKNYYKNLQKKRDKIISINYLSQALKSILFSQPSKARNNPTVLTKKDEDYQELYNDDYDITVYYNAIVLRKSAEEFLRKEFFVQDLLDDAMKKYYYLHLTRILASLICGSAEINHHLLKGEEKFKNISNEQKDESIRILKEILEVKRLSNQNFNFEIYAKNPEIDTLIIEKLNNYFSYYH